MEGNNKVDQTSQPTPTPTATATAPTMPTSSPDHRQEKRWGTQIMGPPAAPTAHPENQQAAGWGVQADHQPYVLEYKPVEKKGGSPMETILDVFNEWSHKAETLAFNVWNNLKAGSSVSGAAWGKLNLTAKALTEGGFEKLYKQTFPVDPNETLKKTFACYLSTSAGPVAGTIYLSNLNIAFCSDRPLSFTAPSGQQAWSYYKVFLPLAKAANIEPVTMKDKPPEKYIHIITMDGHEFWFMGFVNYDKAMNNLLEFVSTFAAAQRSVEPAPAV